MKYKILGLCTLSLAFGAASYGQNSDAMLNQLQTRLPNGATVITPPTAKVNPEDASQIAHTSFKVYVPAGRPEGVVGFSQEEFEAVAKQPIMGSLAETPATLACIYGVTAAVVGCNPNTLTAVAGGGSKAIAVISAYDYPTALTDLKAYAKYWGLPAPSSTNFTVSWVKTKPSPDPNCKAYGGNNCWAANSALYIEMAYAMAPKAHIYLVEAASSGIYDLYAAVKQAKTLLAGAGGGEIAMSFGVTEASYETLGDSLFTSTSGVPIVFFAALDNEDAIAYPATSPNVVAVGGTSISRNPTTLNFQGELTSETDRGGVSAYEPRPSFQDPLKTMIGSFRAVPDLAAVSNVQTGVWVYDSYDNSYGGTVYPWLIFGGTAVATPLVAGIVNNAGHFSASSAAELAMIYTNAAAKPTTPPMFVDITDGACGPYDGYLAVKGWDFCTGNGALYGTVGK